MSVLLNAVESMLSMGARRTPGGWLGRILPYYCVAVAVWVVYSTIFAIIDVWVMAAIFLCATYGVLFLVVAPLPGSQTTRIPWHDWLLSALSLAAGGYFALNGGEIAQRISLLDPLDDAQLLFGTILFVTTLEATRRTTGLGLTLIVAVFTAYNLFGHHLGGALGHGLITYEHFLDINIFTTEGVLGLPVRVAATYAFLFVLFGTLLSRCGGGDFFFNFSAALTGRRVGGPAKVAVVSSGFYGMISGSPTSDVVTTGSVTIPMMKRMGYKPHFAGAVETAASAGGALLPPVMGSAAFIMAEYSGIPYREIVIAAIVPALLYYMTVYVQVHLRSQRLGLSGMEQVPSLRESLRGGGIFLVPLAALTAALLSGYSPQLVAVLGALSVVLVSLVSPRHRMGFGQYFRALGETTLRIVPVAGACAAAGLVIGGLSMTGLAGKISLLVLSTTGASLFWVLFSTAVLTILLGCGMPTGSAYILAAVLLGPMLVELGLHPMSAHMFILYFACISAITPPIAVAAYAAASIAEANPLRIGAAAVKLALSAFIVPFAFAYGPELLLIGEPVAIAVHIATAVAGFVVLSIAAEGYFRGHLPPWQRLLLAAGGLLFVVPSYEGLGVAVLLLALAFLPLVLARRRGAGEAFAAAPVRPAELAADAEPDSKRRV